MKKLISVIVPVYNVEKYLEKCIKSIVNQTYKNLEIILVNDGSTDSSESICRKFARSDDRIVVLKKTNGGLSDARNYGLDRCNGDLVFFIDSDDYMDEKCLEILHSYIEKYDVDIATTLSVRFCDGENPKTSKGGFKVFDSEKALEKLLYQKGCTTSAWGKLYKRELLNDIRYPVGKICEDLPVTYKLFAKSKKIAIGRARMYYYLQRRNSIVHSSFKPARFEAMSFAKSETIFIRKKYPKIVKAAINREFMEAVYIQNNLLSSKMGQSRYYLESQKIIDKYRKTVMLDVKATLESRIYSVFGVEKIKKFKRALHV